MLKTILDSLYVRVVVAYKSTLIAMALAGADAVLSVLGTVQLPAWAHAIVGLAVTLLALYKGKAGAVVGAAVVLALCFAGPARADTLAGSTAVIEVCLHGQDYCLRPGVGFSGSAYNFTTHTIARSITASGLLEITLPGQLKDKIGVLVGPGFQTGDVQGLALLQGISLPFNLAVTVSELLTGSSVNVTLAAGTVIRF